MKHPVVARANTQERAPVAEGEVPWEVGEKRRTHCQVRSLIYYPLS